MRNDAHLEHPPLPGRVGLPANEAVAGARRRPRLVPVRGLEDAEQRHNVAVGLSESEERYRDLFENAGEPIATADLEGMITEVNRAFERTLGYPRAELIGTRLSDYVTEPSQALADLARERKLAGELDTTTYEQVFTASDGRHVTLEVSTRVIRKDGRAVEIQGACRDVTDRVIAAADLRVAAEMNRHLALHDPLTGLPNRASFHDRVRHGLRSADPADGGLVVLLVDLDGFKDVNDTLGHEHGDRLLAELGARLRANFRSGDVVSRRGGDEFGILISDCVVPEEAADEALRRISSALTAPFDLKGLAIAVEASIGVALHSAHAPDGDSFIQHAEIALSVAKERSETHATYCPEMRRASVDKLTLVNELRRALDQRELVVHYQPIVAVESGRIVGAEALVRWNHPRRGLVLPGAFVPLIEQTGLIMPLTLFVLSEALAQQRSWRAHGFDGKIAVNVSVRTLLDELLPDKVSSLLDEFGTPPGKLVVELTESAILVDSAPIRSTLLGLRHLGVGIALDDFGVGYSSLAHLTTLPLDQLKIDRSFVTNAHAHPAKAAIARSMVELARQLGLEIVAEGVESPADRRFVQGLGCSIAQGYHLGRPIPPAQFLRVLSTNGL